jgi:uncharacterized protein (DUF362 family)
MISVIVETQKNRSQKDVLETMLQSASEKHWLSGLKEVRKVIIKPNLCFLAPWESGVTTNAELVELLIKYIRIRNSMAEILIIESDSNDRKCKDAFEMLGYTALEEKYGVKLLNLTEEPCQEVIVPELHHSIMMPEIFFENVFFISVAQLKVHSYQKISCVCKNQFGCVPDEIKKRYHQYMEETLYTLNKLLKPDLSIIDGKIGLEGIGPVTGTPVRTDLMLMSNDPTAIDTVAAEIMGLNPWGIPHLAYVYKKDGTGPDDFTGEGIEDIPVFQFKTDSSFPLIRTKINATRFTDSLNKRLKRTAEKIYGFPYFVRRVWGFGKRKMKALVGRG